jgi:hypothetical protein
MVESIESVLIMVTIQTKHPKPDILPDILTLSNYGRWRPNPDR